MKNHKHRKKLEHGPFGFSGCVVASDSPGHCNPKSHGGVRYIEECACGALQKVNCCNLHVERSGWYYEEGENHDS